MVPQSNRSVTRTGGRAATSGVIPGRFALSVGMPDRPAPDGWTWTALSEVARLETGHTPSRKHPEYWGGDVPWIGIRDATANHGRTISTTHENTNELGIANSSARLLPAGTVCLSRTASVGYVVVMGRPMATSQDFVNWVCSDHIDSRYLKYVLLAEHDSMLRFASGTTHQTIYFPEVKAFHVCLPSLREQCAIAHILSALDDKIELNRQLSETSEAIARAIYQSWFELGEIPEGWRMMPLPTVIEINPARSLRKGEVAPYLDMASMPTRGHSPEVLVDRPVGSGTRFVNGDTLVARITPCLENGKTAYVDFLDEGQVGWGSTEYIVLRPKPPLPEEFAYCLARSDGFRDFAIQSMTGSSGRQRVPTESLSHYLVAVPPEDIAVRFGSFVRPLFTRASAAARESEALASLRDTLLPKLVSGDLRIKDAEHAIEEAV